MLYQYMKDVQRLIRDQGQEFVNPQDLIEYINRARRQIALRTHCVRILTPVSGSITVANITAPGSGYVNPVATISAPDFPSGLPTNPNGLQATATVQQIGGIVTNINITNGGSGYFQPKITITDNGGPGTSATAVVKTSPLTTTNQGQEVYRFADIPLINFPGVQAVFWVNSIAIIYAQFRYQLFVYSFSVYQALIRNYPTSYQYVPSVAAQLGQGESGSVYLYPIASQPYQMEFDCFCRPIDLVDDQSVEAIPQPWQDLVAFYAAHFAFLELQNLNSAAYYLKLFETEMQTYNQGSRPRRVSNRYGRWTWLTPLLLPALDALHHVAGPLVS